MLYKKLYNISLGEQIHISPFNIKSIKFIYCKNLPSGLLFDNKKGIISGIFEKEDDTEIVVKYITDKIYVEKINISVKKYIPDSNIIMENISNINIVDENITYHLKEIIDDIQEIDNEMILDISEESIHNTTYSTIENNIKKSISDLSLPSSMKYMHVNGANTFVYKI